MLACKKAVGALVFLLFPWELFLCLLGGQVASLAVVVRGG